MEQPEGWLLKLTLVLESLSLQLNRCSLILTSSWPSPQKKLWTVYIQVAATDGRMQ